MFFIGRVTTAQLQLTTPLECCCNCGAKGDITLVETPLQRTRYFLFFGTQLELRETFPYCRKCKRSARRVALSWPARFLVTCVLVASAFLCLVLTAPHLPALVQQNLFDSAIVLGVALAWLHFAVVSKGTKQRSYYQPVALAGIELVGEQLRFLHLRFTNEDYARGFASANSELVASGWLQVSGPRRRGTAS